MSTEKVDISFCLPIYNVGEFVKDCIRSIVAQPFGDLTYEILCLDDCSTDDSFALLQQLAQENQCMKVMQNEKNSGVCFTRNRMMEQAKGEYIWFVDPDDMLATNAVQYVRKARDVNADVFFGNYTRVPEKTAFSKDAYLCDCEQKELKWYTDFFPRDDVGVTLASVCCGIFRRGFLLESGLRLNEKMIAQEDTLFCYEFAQKTDKIYKSESLCYVYRQRETSVMHARSDERSKKYYLSILEMLQVYQRYLNTGECKDRPHLEERIVHAKESIVTCLANVKDNQFVKEQFSALKRQGVYPFPFRKSCITESGNKVIGTLRFLLPVPGMFYVYRGIYHSKDFISKLKNRTK